MSIISTVSGELGTSVDHRFCVHVPFGPDLPLVSRGHGRKKVYITAHS